ncbi:MAG: hypothetical protein ABIJ95_10500 [Pseudomonadota bacterium]
MEGKPHLPKADRFRVAAYDLANLRIAQAFGQKDRHQENLGKGQLGIGHHGSGCGGKLFPATGTPHPADFPKPVRMFAGKLRPAAWTTGAVPVKLGQHPPLAFGLIQELWAKRLRRKTDRKSVLGLFHAHRLGPLQNFRFGRL